MESTKYVKTAFEQILVTRVINGFQYIYKKKQQAEATPFRLE